MKLYTYLQNDVKIWHPSSPLRNISFTVTQGFYSENERNKKKCERQNKY